jgi:H+-translocating NAD(P) transhydrogenase subunit alpha
MPQLIGVPRETAAGEKRVATVPEVAEKLIKLGFRVAVQPGAGDAANFSDDAYRAAGAQVVANVWASADIIFKVRAPSMAEVELLRPGTTLVSFLWPAQNPQLMQALAERKPTVLAMDSVPRISRAQKLDALSSMANIAGYRAVIEAAHAFGRFFAGQITAAGKVPPAKVFVIGAGVAGLAAIGTASGLGAIVRANDTRPEVADQIKSLGGEYVGVDYREEGTGTGGYAKVMSEGFQKAQREVFAKQAKEVDVIITTALIPGKPAPKLISADMVRSMRPGSVIVDLAAEQGGNCELTVPGEAAVRHGVTIIGYTDLAARLPTQASQLYGTNLVNLMKLLTPGKDGVLVLDFDDVVQRTMTVSRDGELLWPPPAIQVSAAPVAAAVVSKQVVKEPDRPKDPRLKYVGMAVGAAAFALIAAGSPPSFLGHFTVFALAVVIGYYVIGNVHHALHTPLMSVTNAISGIIVVGALLQLGTTSTSGGATSTVILVLAFIATLIASINIFGGFTVTRRMLTMFRKG